MTYIHTLHTYIHTYIHTYMHTYIHMYIHPPPCAFRHAGRVIGPSTGQFGGTGLLLLGPPLLLTSTRKGTGPHFEPKFQAISSKFFARVFYRLWAPFGSQIGAPSPPKSFKYAS